MRDTGKRNWPELADEVGAILRCPSCQGVLQDEKGAVACPECGSRFPFRNGVLCFVAAEHYAGSFGFQWLKHERTQLDNPSSRRSEIDFTRKTGLTGEDLAGKLVLDVGCGMGRYADVVSRWGARLVAVDLSVAVEAAARNLANRSNVTVIQADALALPFAPESFDYIYSLGVLHHTPNCEEAFKALTRLLKPGGGIAIWLYSASNRWYRMSDLYRKLTRRMPARLLYDICYFAVPLYHVHTILKKIPLAGRRMSGALTYLLPMSFEPDARWRWLDTFDWYSPRYQSKHTYEEVFRWFGDCGLEHVHAAAVPVSVRGTKPPQVEMAARDAEPEVARCAE
jgi:SAM-dependent methyltransferase